jgi:hypothetical protein
LWYGVGAVVIGESLVFHSVGFKELFEGGHDLFILAVEIFFIDCIKDEDGGCWYDSDE